MKITIGMPEFLLLYSLAMFNVSWSISVITLILALASRSIDTLVEHGSQQKKDDMEKK